MENNRSYEIFREWLNRRSNRVKIWARSASISCMLDIVDPPCFKVVWGSIETLV